MPSPGEIVCFYTHEHSDGNHMTVDAIGLVLKSTEDYLVLKVFEEGVAPHDERAYYYEGPEYDERGNLIVGKRYWRELGEDAPDFDAPLYRDPASQEAIEEHTYETDHDTELAKLQERQRVEGEAWTGNKESLAAKHERELEEFENGWDASYKAPGQPVAASGLTLKTPIQPPPTISKSLPRT